VRKGRSRYPKSHYKSTRSRKEKLYKSLNPRVPKLRSDKPCKAAIGPRQEHVLRILPPYYARLGVAPHQV
jgi:hypothetical protein